MRGKKGGRFRAGTGCDEITYPNAEYQYYGKIEWIQILVHSVNISSRKSSFFMEVYCKKIADLLFTICGLISNRNRFIELIYVIPLGINFFYPVRSRLQIQ